MDLLQYNGYEGTAELDMSRMVCRGKLLYIDDLVTYEASSPDALKQEFEAAVTDYLETCAQLGKAPQRPFKGLFNVRVPPALHKAAAMRATCDGVALNDVVVQALTAFLSVRAEVDHRVTVTFEGSPTAVRTFAGSTSGAEIKWMPAHVH